MTSVHEIIMAYALVFGIITTLIIIVILADKKIDPPGDDMIIHWNKKHYRLVEVEPTFKEVK